MGVPVSGVACDRNNGSVEGCDVRLVVLVKRVFWCTEAGYGGQIRISCVLFDLPGYHPQFENEGSGRRIGR